MGKKLFLIIGAPGSGKTTDASMIAKRHSDAVVHYSVGDMLRDEIAIGSTLGKEISTYIKKGELVPLEIIMHTVITAMKYAPTDVILIDGYPRSIEQMEVLERLLAEESGIELVAVIETRVSEETAKKRIQSREALAQPGQKRSDDSEEIFHERMKVYSESLDEIKRYYSDKRLLKVIDGENSLDIVVSMMELFILSRTDIPSVHSLNDSYRKISI